MATTASFPTPPQAPPKWNYTPTTITNAVNASIESSTDLLDRIGKLSPAECTFESVVRPLALREGVEAQEVECGMFLQYVSIDEAVRNAAVEGEKKMLDFGLSSITRLDIYEALLTVKKTTPASQLNPEEQRLLDKMLLERTRNGLNLSQDKREELLAVKKQIMLLAVDFQRNCNEEAGFLLFTKEQLAGVPDISGYEAVDGNKLKVTYKSPDIIPVFKYATSSDTRKAAVLGYEGKTIQNADLLAQIVTLRRKGAAILGYENWAAHVIENKMAKTPKTVLDFLQGLQKDLTPIALKEKSALLALKEEECASLGIPFVNELFLWDYRYYDRLFLEKTLAVDEEAIKEYFPVGHVVKTVLDIYQEVLNIRIHLVPRTAQHGGMTWHEDASMYAVYDAGEKNDFLGYLHLDLFPRTGKYGHAAVWGLIPGVTAEDSSRSYPVVAMVANLAKATSTRPALMKHNDVVTFFHELGHAWHGICSKTQFARFHGTAVARDFVEAPSQMLENWCWDASVLKRITKHYETQQPLPDATIKSLIASKSVNQGLFNLRQLFHGMYDMRVHTATEDTDLTKLWVDLREEVSLVSTDGTYVGGQSGFAHIVGGYEAGYYGYLWAQVFSADMFSTVFEPAPMNLAAGMKYRKEILEVGGSRDEQISLHNFLGREPSNKPFLDSLLGPK